MTIRRATLADARAIASIHVRSWQAAYEGIVPSDYLRSLSIDSREAFWRESLEGNTTTVYIAEDLDVMLGWVCAAQSRDPDARPSTGEVWAIYVDPRYWRRGVGRALWHEAAAHLRDSGFREVTLWVLRDNRQALAFYESIGFAVESGHEETIVRGGVELVEVRLRHTLVNSYGA